MDVAQVSHSFQTAITCSKLTIETLEQGVKYFVFVAIFEHFRPCSSVSIFNLEQVNAGWVRSVH